MGTKVVGCSTNVFFLLLLSCLWIGAPSVSYAQRDTLKPGEALGFSDYVTSANGRFRFGFFDPNSVDLRYLGVWYKDDKSFKVWVANRTTPVTGTAGNLTMDSEGLLKIMQADEANPNPIILNPNQAAKNSLLSLQDNGNLVLSELNQDGSFNRTLWQSFDHPSDSLLPEMKLGVNFRTGQRFVLSSWLSDDIAAPGTFSLEWNYTSQQLVARRRGEIYWMSGKLNASDRSFENIPWLMEAETFGNNYNFSSVSNEEESYFSYSVLDGAISRWYLGPAGQFYDGIKPAFIVNGTCYEAPGCQLQKPACKKNDFFQKRTGIMLGQTVSAGTNFSIGMGDCAAQCWDNCSCAAYTTNTANGTGCLLWSTDSNFRYGSGADAYVLNSYLPEYQNNKGKGNNWWIWLLVASAAVLTSVIFGFSYYLWRKKHQGDEDNEAEEILLRLNSSDKNSNDGRNGSELKIFTLASIMAATNDFSSENKLGEGGFGPVYKGKLPDEQEIAVKRLSGSSGQGLVEFRNELLLIAKLQHMNLVRLLGCCVKGQEKMLVYEYMPNKSLDFFLFDPARREILTWETRYNIIQGIAQGLLYLHRYSRLRIIHRDLKASNILLDAELNPKISDFGMARIFGRNEHEANTNRVVGTYGYMSPEYAMEGNFSEKSDVYSFGVLLLEIISGRKNSGIFYKDHTMNLMGFAWELWTEGKASEFLDMEINESTSKSQALRCLHVGLLCVQEKAGDRPAMSDIVPMLTNETVPLPALKAIAFFHHQQVMKSDASAAGTEQERHSMNVVSITQLVGR